MERIVFIFLFVGPALDLDTWIKERLVKVGELEIFSFHFVGPVLDLDYWKKKVSREGMGDFFIYFKRTLLLFFVFFVGIAS